MRINKFIIYIFFFFINDVSYFLVIKILWGFMEGRVFKFYVFIVRGFYKSYC